MFYVEIRVAYVIVGVCAAVAFCLVVATSVRFAHACAGGVGERCNADQHTTFVKNGGSAYTWELVTYATIVLGVAFWITVATALRAHFCMKHPPAPHVPVGLTGPCGYDEACAVYNTALGMYLASGVIICLVLLIGVVIARQPLHSVVSVVAVVQFMHYAGLVVCVLWLLAGWTLYESE